MGSKLILASNSPRRREILRMAGIPFEAVPSTVEEHPGADETPEQYVRRLAVEKAVDVARRMPTGSLVLGADTEVEIEGRVLGKPQDAAHAAAMLLPLSGRSHRVITGLCLLGPQPGSRRVETVTTIVWFATLTGKEIDEYVRSGEPMDKAGAYGIQGLAGKFVERIEGCYYNVMGLPVATVYRLLKEQGWKAD